MLKAQTFLSNVSNFAVSPNDSENCLNGTEFLKDFTNYPMCKSRYELSILPLLEREAQSNLRQSLLSPLDIVDISGCFFLNMPQSQRQNTNDPQNFQILTRQECVNINKADGKIQSNPFLIAESQKALRLKIGCISLNPTHDINPDLASIACGRKTFI